MWRLRFAPRPACNAAPAMGKILIVEDDHAMGTALRDGIEYEGHVAVLEGDGDSGLRRARDMRPDVIVLDWMLPRVSGLDVCRRLRADHNDVPIIMLTSRSQEIDKIVGLKSGADDYITKPFSFTELMARIEAVLRRSGRAARGLDWYEFGDVRIGFRSHEVTKGNRPLTLSAREFKLLEYLVSHRGKVITRDELLAAVWGFDGSAPLTRTVDMHIAKLRQKIETTPNDPRHIMTLHRVGYKFLG